MYSTALIKLSKVSALFNDCSDWFCVHSPEIPALWFRSFCKPGCNTLLNIPILGTFLPLLLICSIIPIFVSFELKCLARIFSYNTPIQEVLGARGRWEAEDE